MPRFGSGIELRDDQPFLGNLRYARMGSMRHSTVVVVSCLIASGVEVGKNEPPYPRIGEALTIGGNGGMGKVTCLEVKMKETMVPNFFGFLL